MKLKENERYREVFNGERFHIGLGELIAFNIFLMMGFTLDFPESWFTKYSDLTPVLFIFLYYVLFPFVFQGRTLFMVILRLELRTKNDEKIGKLLAVRRMMLKYATIIPHFFVYTFLRRRDGIPFYDRILGIKIIDTKDVGRVSDE